MSPPTFFSRLFGLLCISAFPYEFKNQLDTFCKNGSWGFGRGYVETLDQFMEYFYLNNTTEAPNSLPHLSEIRKYLQDWAGERVTEVSDLLFLGWTPAGVSGYPMFLATFTQYRAPLTLTWEGIEMVMPQTQCF